MIKLILFVVLILICLFAGPIWWVLCCIIKTVVRVINYFIQRKKDKGGDKYDVTSDKWIKIKPTSFKNVIAI
ncbi:hypothetical protein ACMBCM_01640 [Spiroplasma sp. K1]